MRYCAWENTIEEWKIKFQHFNIVYMNLIEFRRCWVQKISQDNTSKNIFCTTLYTLFYVEMHSDGWLWLKQPKSDCNVSYQKICEAPGRSQVWLLLHKQSCFHKLTMFYNIISMLLSILQCTCVWTPMITA
jgi:hypothetical protein